MIEQPHSICSSCNLYRNCKSPNMNGIEVGGEPKVIILSMCPTRDEDKTNNLIAGADLDMVINSIENQYNFYFTKLVKCMPKDEPLDDESLHRSPSRTEFDACTTVFHRELKKYYNCEIIITLGKEVTEYVLNKQFEDFSSMVGKPIEHIIRDRKYTIIPNFSGIAVKKNTNRAVQFRTVLTTALSNKWVDQSKIERSILLNYEQSMSYMQDIIDKYKRKDIQWTVYDKETTSLDVFKAQVLMSSFSHDLDHRGVVVPYIVNNKIHRDPIWQMVGNISVLRRNEEFMKIGSLPPLIERADKILREGLTEFDFKLEDLYSEIEEFVLRKFPGYAQVPIEKLELVKLLCNYKPVEFTITEQQSKKLLLMTKEIVETIPLVGHNIKYDLKVANAQLNVDLSKVKVKSDTLVLSHHLYGRVFGQGLGLKELSKRNLDVIDDWDKDIGTYLSMFRLVEERHFGNIPTGILARYSGLDSYYNRQLFHKEIESIKPEQMEIYEHVNSAVVPYADAENKGITIDEPMLEFLREKFIISINDTYQDIISKPTVKRFIQSILDAQMKEYNEKVEATKTNPRKRIPKVTPSWETALDSFSIGSIPQMRKLVYESEYYHLPTNEEFKSEKTQEYSTGADVIEWFLNKVTLSEEARSFLKALEKYKLLNKLFTTYIEGIPREMKFGSYKTEFNLTGTTTGRLSSGFHTLASKSDIKRIFTTRWRDEGGLFLCCDYSQLEVRIGASISKEFNLIDAYKNDIDIHTNTAVNIQKVLQNRDVGMDEITKDQRGQGKCVTPDTLIFTDKGEVPIYKIVGWDGMMPPDNEIIDKKTPYKILTVDGYRDIDKVFRQSNQEIVKVSLEDGKSLRCTPNHRFVIGFDGKNTPIFKRADELTPEDEVLVLDV